MIAAFLDSFIVWKFVCASLVVIVPGFGVRESLFCKFGIDGCALCSTVFLSCGSFYVTVVLIACYGVELSLQFCYDGWYSFGIAFEFNST